MIGIPRGSGRNEKAQYSERPDDYVTQLDRLDRKFETARQHVPKPIVHRVLAVVGLGHRKALGFQVVGQHRPLRRFVLDQQDPRLSALAHPQVPVPVLSTFGRSSSGIAPVTR